MTNEAVILCILLIIGFFFVWSRCTLSCKRTSEGYKRSGLSEEGPMKRSPVTTAFRGNGMDKNSHYQADPSDELVPLEYGGADFYKDSRKLAAGQMFDELGEDYQGRGMGSTYIVNDGRTRADMVSSGEMGWYRLLNNMVTSKHVQSTSGGPTEADFATATPISYTRGLYHPSYHNDHVGN